MPLPKSPSKVTDLATPTAKALVTAAELASALQHFALRAPAEPHLALAVAREVADHLRSHQRRDPSRFQVFLSDEKQKIIRSYEFLLDQLWSQFSYSR